MLINFQPGKNSTTAANLLSLLGLCGDVHPHPGPSIRKSRTRSRNSANKIKFPCTQCDEEVRDNQRALSCDGCGRWTHTICSDISNEEYTKLTEIGDFAWLCPACVTLNSNLNDSFSNTSDNTEVDDSETLKTISSKRKPTQSRPLTCDNDTRPQHQRDKNQKRSGLKILNINFQSIKSKVEEFQVLLEAEQPDILICTETWLNADIKNCEIFPDHYQVFRKDRADGYGGVMIAVKNMTAQILDELSVNAELLWIKLDLGKNAVRYVGAYYNPNSSTE